MSGFLMTQSMIVPITTVEKITAVNDSVNGFVWGLPMLILLVGTGILMTCLTKFFQITHIRHWFSKTISSPARISATMSLEPMERARDVTLREAK